MKALVRASLIGSLTLVAAMALTACTRSAPLASTPSENASTRVAQVLPESDMPEVVITASRSGKSVLAGEENKARRL
jgi:hypothetical protein